MIGNGNCDSSCNVASCRYDGLDCGCAPMCDESDYGTCKAACLVLACAYDFMPGFPACEDAVKVKTARIYQAASQDYTGSYVFDSMCASQDSLCVSYLWQVSQTTCIPECQTLGCLNSFGHCDSVCPSNCLECAGLICIACSPGWVLFSSECLQNCPEGFLSSPKMPGVCFISQESGEFTYYVSKRTNSARIGNAAFPFQSLSEALAAIQGRNATIYLLTGAHKLDKAVLSASLHAIGDQALFQSSAISSGILHIMGCLCEECGHAECGNELPTLLLDNLSPITLQFSGNVTIEKVGFLGNGTLVMNCESEMCTYCPLISGSMKNDRGQKAEEGSFAPKARCTAFHPYSFLSITPGSALSLRNVSFHGFRQQYSSLISFTSGYVACYNTSFTDIVVNTSVIKQVSAVDYEPGALEIYGCTVSLLNNGYEYEESAVFAGFITSQGIRQLKIHWVTIENGMVGLRGTVISLGNFESVWVFECSFHRIVGQVLVISSTASFATEGDSNHTLALYSTSHIRLENSIFENISGSSLIAVNMSGNLLNTLIASNRFMSCLSTSSGLLNLRLLRTALPIELRGGLMAVKQGTERVHIAVPKSFTRVEQISWEDCAVAGEGLLSVMQLPNVAIGLITVKGTKEMTVYAATISKMIGTPGLYMSLPAGNTGLSPCVSLVILSQLSAVSVTTGSFSRNRCATAGLVGVSLSSTSLSALEFSSNTAGNAAMVLSLSLSSAAHISGLTVTSNQSGAAASQAVVVIVAGNGEVVLSQCLFQGNKAASSPALSCSGFCTILDSAFIANSAKTATAAGLVYSPLVSAKQLTIKRCRFIGNSSSYGGALMLYDPAAVSNAIQVSVEDTSFESNASSSYGSCVLITTTVQLTTQSVITRAQFINNFSVFACVFIGFKAGILNITDSVFRNTTSVAYSVLMAQPSSPTDASPSLVRLLNCLIELNTGPAILQLYTTSTSQYVFAESYNLTFRFNRGRGVLLQQLANWKDYYSTFLNNTSVDSAGAFKVSALSKLQVIGSRFQGNVGTLASSAIHTGGLTQTFIINSTFVENIGRPGAAIYVEQMGFLVAQGCTFVRNTNTQLAAAISFFIGTQVFLQVIDNCTFVENQCDSGAGAIALESANLTISNSYFLNNKAPIYTEIVSYLSTISVSNSVFRRNQPFAGTFITAIADSVLSLQRVEFDGSTKAEKGAAVSILSGLLTIKESRFHHLQAEMGAAVAIYSGCRYSIESSMFEEVTAGLENGGALVIFESQGNVSSSTFQRYTNGAIVASYSRIQIVGCTFQRISHLDGDNIRGAALSCSECPAVTISNSLFKNLTAQSAGAILLKVTTIWYYYSVLNCTFDSTQTALKGAVLFSNADGLIQDSRFLNNFVGKSGALEGSGGGLYLECPDRPAGCSVRVEHCSFLGNQARYSGGGIVWTDSKPELRNLIFANNTALYGADIASFPITLSYSQDSPTLQKEISAVPSGQQAQDTLVVYLLDHYNHVVTVDNASYATLQPVDQQQASVSGVTRVLAVLGVFTFEEYTIVSAPGGSVTIGIYTNAVNINRAKGDDDTKFSENVTVLTSMRTCLIGEAQINNYCEVCPYGKYNLEAGSTCETCPTGAICYGNYTLVPEAGYWRNSATSDTIWKCLQSEACLGSPEPPAPLSLIGDCATGYFGNLCHGCLAGFSRSGRNGCSRCPDLVINIVRIVGVSIATIIAVLVVIKTSLISAHRSRSPYSIYFKIFINYLQLITATAVFDFKWPSYVLQMLKIQESVGNVSEQIFSFDCFITSSRADEGELTYLRVVIVSCLPLLVLAGAIVWWSLVSWVRRSTTYLKHHLVNSIVVLFFLVHPSIVKVMFDIFNCKELDNGKSWLSSNLTISCWDEQHRRYAMGVALPGILVWGVAVPLLALLRLCIKRRTLDMLETRIHFGFLYNGYRTQRFYWEFIILYRKIIIITIAVFVLNISVAIQALCAMLVLVLAVVFQMREAPYINAVLNKLEHRAIVVAAVTVYCGMWFMTGDIGELSKVVMLVVIVAANVYFLLLWSVQVCQLCASFFNKLLVALKVKTGAIPISPVSNVSQSHKISIVNVSHSGSGEQSVNQSKVRPRQYDDSSDDVNLAFHREPREPRIPVPDNSMVGEDSASITQK